jgi:SAM-dependent methyltransferase
VNQRPTRRYRTAGRSLRLFRSFLVEQTDPERFYGDLAADTVELLAGYTDLQGTSVLDVGAGPRQFAAAFGAAGARYVGLDVTVGDLSAAAVPDVVGVGERLPFADASIDVVMSSNVMEHVARPGAVAREMVRVTRPGGLVFVSYTAWASPWGGHETSPWHVFGGEYAALRYERENGRPPKNLYGESRFAARVGDGVRWARSQPDLVVEELSPRYHPDWARFVVEVPVLREVATWNLMMVLRRR